MMGLRNWSVETFHHARAHVPVLEQLEEIIVSGEVGLIKPDPRIFHHLIAALDVTPAHAVLVDDSAPNIETARALGFTGVQYTNVANLKVDRAELGLTYS